MNAYTFDACGSDGNVYGVRLLLTEEEFDQLQRVGLVPHNAQQIVSMQDAADTLVAMFERQAPGVVVQ